MKQQPTNFNRYIPLKDIMPKDAQPKLEQMEEQPYEHYDNIGNFTYKNPNSEKLEREINRRLMDIEDQVKK